MSWAYDIYRSEQFVSRKHIYEILIAESSLAIVIVDHRGLILVFNNAAERLFETRRRDVLNRSLSVLMPPPLRAAHRDRFGLSEQKVGNAFRHPSPHKHVDSCQIQTATGVIKTVALDLRDIGDQTLLMLHELPDLPARPDNG